MAVKRTATTRVASRIGVAVHGERINPIRMMSLIGMTLNDLE
jgi:hypothetical protein